MPEIVGLTERALSLGYTVVLMAVAAVTFRACLQDADTRPARVTVAVVAMLALLARVVAAGATGTLAHPEMYEYELIAGNALTGHGFEYVSLGTAYHAYGTPLYFLVNTAVYDFTARSSISLLVLTAAVSALTAPVAVRLAARLWDERAGAIAGALVAIHPPLLAYAGKLHPLGIEAFLAAAAVFWGARWIERPSARVALWLGGSVAIGAMSRPAFLLILIPLAWLMIRSTGVRHALRDLATVAAVTTVLLLPWTGYVSELYGRPVFMNMSGGVVFWYGNNPEATGTAYGPDGEPILSRAPPELIVKASNTDDVTADAAFREAAMAHVRTDPAGFVGRIGLKLLYFWTISPTAGVLYPAAWRVGYLTYYLVVATLAVAGLAIWLRGQRRGGTAVVLMLGSATGVALVQSLFYVDGRHRWEIESFLLVLAAGAVYALVSALRPSAGPAVASASRSR